MRTLASFLGLLFVALVAAAQLRPAAPQLLMVSVSGSRASFQDPVGEVRFFQHANSSFDPYTLDPDAGEQAWMREHYSSMLTYTTYFDSRTSWFPAALVYKDSYAIYNPSDVANNHPDWILRDSEDNPLYIPFACSGGTCPQYAGDLGNPDFRAFWIAEATTALAEGYAGLFIDDVNLEWRVSDGNGDFVNPIDPRTDMPMTLAAWKDNFADLVEEVRAAFPTIQIAHNALWFAGTPGGDADIERQVLASDYFNLERGATDGGLTGGGGTFGFETWLAFIDELHSLGVDVIVMDYGTTTTQREYALAAYFLASNGRDLISSDQLSWTAPDMWWDGYETYLGGADGARYEPADGLLRRDFECGTVLLNQPGATTRMVELGGSYQTLEGATVSEVTLAASTGAVLTSSCQSL